ncbi:unnamed protein product, partial [Mesorhabditis belari]|uniref:Uncharacterized protein n=1 Tax=Mesorhabditis belari TaxID=2138241 RepID=A0AAF3EEU2_9BILA
MLLYLLSPFLVAALVETSSKNLNRPSLSEFGYYGPFTSRFFFNDHPEEARRIGDRFAQSQKPTEKISPLRRKRSTDDLGNGSSSFLNNLIKGESSDREKHVEDDPSDTDLLMLLAEYSKMRNRLRALERHLERSSLLKDFDEKTKGDDEESLIDSLMHLQKKTHNTKKTTETTEPEKFTTDPSIGFNHRTEPVTEQPQMSGGEAELARILETGKQTSFLPSLSDPSMLSTDGESMFEDITAPENPPITGDTFEQILLGDTMTPEMTTTTTTEATTTTTEPTTRRTSTRSSNSQHPRVPKSPPTVVWTYNPEARPIMIGFKANEKSSMSMDYDLESSTTTAEPTTPTTTTTTTEQSTTRHRKAHRKAKTHHVEKPVPLPTMSDYVPIVVGPKGEPIILPHYIAEPLTTYRPTTAKTQRVFGRGDEMEAWIKNRLRQQSTDFDSPIPPTAPPTITPTTKPTTTEKLKNNRSNKKKDDNIKDSEYSEEYYEDDSEEETKAKSTPPSQLLQYVSINGGPPVLRSVSSSAHSRPQPSSSYTPLTFGSNGAIPYLSSRLPLDSRYSGISMNPSPYQAFYMPMKKKL